MQSCRINHYYLTGEYIKMTTMANGENNLKDLELEKEFTRQGFDYKGLCRNSSNEESFIFFSEKVDNIEFQDSKYKVEFFFTAFDPGRNSQIALLDLNAHLFRYSPDLQKATALARYEHWYVDGPFPTKDQVMAEMNDAMKMHETRERLISSLFNGITEDLTENNFIRLNIPKRISKQIAEWGFKFNNLYLFTTENKNEIHLLNKPPSIPRSQEDSDVIVFQIKVQSPFDNDKAAIDSLTVAAARIKTDTNMVIGTTSLKYSCHDGLVPLRDKIIDSIEKTLNAQELQTALESKNNIGKSLKL